MFVVSTHAHNGFTWVSSKGICGGHGWLVIGWFVALFTKKELIQEQSTVEKCVMKLCMHGQMEKCRYILDIFLAAQGVPSLDHVYVFVAWVFSYLQ